MIIFFNDVFYHQAFSKNEAFIDIFNDNFILKTSFLLEFDLAEFNLKGMTELASLTVYYNEQNKGHY